MSFKIFLLICILSCFNKLFPQVSCRITIDVSTPYTKIRNFLDEAINVTRVRTEADLQKKGNELAILDFIGLVQQHSGYAAEEYDVQTEDGYILKLHRITASPLKPKATNKPVVFIKQGLFGSSDNFVILGPSQGLAFALADAGYDVWLGNERGKSYSKRHVKYSSASTNYDFWKFNLDDVAMKDLPILIDTVLKKTNKTKLIYVGFSTGITLNFMLLSSLPEYNEKIILSICLAPAIYFPEPHTSYVKTALPVYKAVSPVLRALEFYELFPLSKLNVAIGKSVCKNFLGKYLCGILMYSTINYRNIDFNTIWLIYTILFDGISLDVGDHYAQIISTKKFRKFDFGPSLNQEKYNSSEPPEYDLSKVTAPQAIFYAVHDTFMNPEGAEELGSKLPNVITFETVPDSYRHDDFEYAKNARIELYDKILNLINKYSQQ